MDGILFSVMAGRSLSEDVDVFDEFLHLCEQGNVDKVEEFLDKHVINIVIGNNDETNALHIAAANGHDAMVHVLLDHGAQLDGVNMYGWTALMQAARHGHTRTVVLLLNQGSRPDLRNKMGATALVCAVQSGHVSTVRAFLDGYEADLRVSELVTYEVTPLMVAAQLGHDPIVRLLVESGFQVNESTRTVGLTPLMMAAANGHKKTAQILVEKGADLDAKTIGGKTALDIAISRGRRHVRSYLEQKMAARKQKEVTNKSLDLFEAIEKGNVEDVASVLKNDRPKVNEIKLDNGATPLMSAAHHGNLTIVQLLVEMGAKIDAQHKSRGCTALMEALFSGNNDVALFLIESGANVNLRANGGLTAFDISTIVDAIQSKLIVLLAMKTNGQRLHPLQAVTSMNELDTISSKRKKPWWDLSRLWQMKTSQTTSESDSVMPFSSAFSKPSITFHNVPVGISATTSFRPTNDMRIRPSFTMCSASPCRAVASETPKRPDPPLLPSLNLDASSAGQFNTSMSRNQIFTTTNDKSPCCVLMPQRVLKYSSSNDKQVDFSQPKEVIADENTFSKSVSSTMARTTIDNLSDVLKKCSLERYESVFNKEEVDLEAFRLLSEPDLRDLGIDSTISRKKLLHVIDRLNNDGGDSNA